MDVGVPELLIVVVVVLVLFGPKRLPDLARSLGEALRELRDGARERTECPPADRDDLGQPTKRGE